MRDTVALILLDNLANWWATLEHHMATAALVLLNDVSRDFRLRDTSGKMTTGSKQPLDPIPVRNDQLTRCRRLSAGDGVGQARLLNLEPRKQRARQWHVID